MPIEVLDFIYTRFIMDYRISHVYIITDQNIEICNKMNTYFLYKNLQTVLKTYTKNIDWVNEIIFDKKVLFILSFIGKEDEHILKLCNTIEESGAFCLYIPWDTHKYPENISHLLNKIYTKAILTDYSYIERQNRIYETLFQKGHCLTVITDNGSNLTFTLMNNAVLENCSLENEMISQLPGGEVFWVPVQGSCNGVINIEGESIRVVKDIADFSKIKNISICDPYAPLCEFGIGTNKNIKNISGLTISEKAAGTCHFGFGHNKNLGGSYNRNYHFDLVLENYRIFMNDSEVTI